MTGGGAVLIPILLLSAARAHAALVPSKTRPYVASSSLASTKTATYGPENVFDFDDSTPWVEGVQGDGVGEWVGLYLGEAEDLQGLTGVRLFTYDGYRRRGRYRENGRALDYQWSIMAGETVVAVSTTIYDPDTLEDEVRNEFTLEMTPPTHGSLWLKASISRVEPGSKWRDTAVAELMPELVGANPHGAAAAVDLFCAAMRSGDDAAASEFTGMTVGRFVSLFDDGSEESKKYDTSPLRCSRFQVLDSETFDVYHGGHGQYEDRSLRCRFHYGEGRWRMSRCARITQWGSSALEMDEKVRRNAERIVHYMPGEAKKAAPTPLSGPPVP